MAKLIRDTSRLAALLMAAALLVLLVVGPSAAAESGSGAVLTGSFTDNGPNCGGTCSPAVAANCGGGVSSTNAGWDQFGTYTASSMSGGSVSHNSYTGSTRATLSSTGRYDFGPLGSYAPNTSCIGVPGYAVPSTHVNVVSVPSGKVSCSLNGTFTRAQVSLVVVRASGTCTVGSGASAVTASVMQTFTLNVAAFPDPLGVGTPQSVIAGADYTEN